MIPYFTFIFSSYTFLAAIGFLCVAIYLFFRMERFNVEFNTLVFYIIIGALFLFLGSRIIFIISCIPMLKNNFSVSQLIHYIFYGGIVFYGGMLGILAAIKICSKIKKQHETEMFNYFTPAIPLFHIWGRMGCFFGGCCYGKPWEWGFPMAADPEIVRIPVQLMESVCNIAIFIILVTYEKKNQNNSVKLLPIYLKLYAICRFILEFFRGDINRGMWGFLSTSQIISLIILFCCLILDLKKKVMLNKVESENIL